MPNTDEATAFPALRESDLVSHGLPGYQSQQPDPNNPAWGIGGALLVWFLSVCLVVFLPQVFLIPYLISKGFHFGTPDEVRALVEFATSDKMAIILQIIALLPSHLLTLLLVWALVTSFGKRPFWESIGWAWAPGFRLRSCIALGILLFILGNAVAKLLGAGKPTPLEQVINSSLAARYLISFFAVATAPVVEEFIYRGLLYASLQRLVGVPGAVVLVLALFTIVHVPQYWPNGGVIAAIAVLSIALTLIRAYSGRLLPCVVVHLVFNGIQAVILVVEPYIEKFAPTTEPLAPPASILLFLLAPLI